MLFSYMIADHDADNILDLGEWKGLDQLEASDGMFEARRAPDN